MGILRSEPMEYVSIIVQEDVAHHLIDEIGENGGMQFTDLNHKLTPFQKRFAPYVRRCDDLERRLRYFESQMEKFKVDSIPAPSWEDFKAQLKAYRLRTPTSLIEELESEFEGTESELKNLDKYRAQLNVEYSRNLELKHVLNKSREFFTTEGKTAEEYLEADVSTLPKDDVESGKVGATGETGPKFNYVTGTILRDDCNAFERLIFRSTRGNAFMRFREIEEEIVDPTTNEAVEKSVFIIFYQAASIERKVIKICDSFGAKRYEVPNLGSGSAVAEVLKEVNSSIEDGSRILRQNSDNAIGQLRSVAANIEKWKYLILKEKAAYHTLNMFRIVGDHTHGAESGAKSGRGNAVLRGEGWVVATRQNEMARLVQEKGERDHVGILNKVPQKDWPQPPTFFKLNKLTGSYQGLVNTYGVPKYGEVNPGLFTCASFPFLFGVMYGDVGHGTLLFLAACFCVWKEKAIAPHVGELFGMVFAGRYMLVGMGAMAIYCGLIYNDFFALTLNLFGSRWGPPASIGNSTEPGWQRIGDVDNVYPIGIDPVWHIASNQLSFLNSLKMKMAILLGVTQMLFGISLKLVNAIHFKKPLDIWFEALPQLVMFGTLFGYACYLILLKWCIDWNLRMAKHQNPPDLLTMLIGIVLSPGTVIDPMFDGQGQTQLYVGMVALICIPLMLFPKPLIIRQQLKAKEALKHGKNGHHDDGAALVDHADGEEEESHGGGDHDEHESFADVAVHQGIETIEFVLGSVSNTASYLRLWALSLAHAQLAEVFLSQALLPQINGGSFIAIIIGYGIWAGATVGVLMMMDVLECFLHTLRLHWVEFQNKFYKGGGYLFEPFSYERIVVKE